MVRFNKRNLVFGAFFAAVIGMLIPMIVRTLTSNFPSAPGNGRLLVSLGVCLLCTILSISLIGAVNDRIVIAHRLSTIKHCDRILVLDGEKIAEEGNYQQLIQKGGLFAELVQRQRLDSPEMSV